MSVWALPAAHAGPCPADAQADSNIVWQRGMEVLQAGDGAAAAECFRRLVADPRPTVQMDGHWALADVYCGQAKYGDCAQEQLAAARMAAADGGSNLYNNSFGAFGQCEANNPITIETEK